MKLFEQINVWRRGVSGESICYRCFRILSSGGYCVQSADYYYSSAELNNPQHERQFLELLTEQEPDERSGSYATLMEAIDAFEREFSSGG